MLGVVNINRIVYIYKRNKFTTQHFYIPKHSFTSKHKFPLRIIYFSFLYCDYPIKVLWFYCSQRLVNYLSFQFFDYECTWWRLCQKRVMYSKLDIYVFITIVRSSYHYMFSLILICMFAGDAQWTACNVLKGEWWWGIFLSHWLFLKDWDYLTWMITIDNPRESEYNDCIIWVRDYSV